MHSPRHGAASRRELLALRYELELLDEALRAGSTPDAARLALDYAFTHLRAAEHAWQAVPGGPPTSAWSSRRSTPLATRSRPSVAARAGR